jgi:hypothetical protein
MVIQSAEDVKEEEKEEIKGSLTRLGSAIHEILRLICGAHILISALNLIVEEFNSARNPERLACV